MSRARARGALSVGRVGAASTDVRTSTVPLVERPATRDAPSPDPREGAPVGVRSRVRVRPGGRLDVLDVEAARGDVRRDEERALAGAELVEHPVALVLGLVAVDAPRGEALVREGPGELVAAALRLDEDDHLVDAVLLEEVGHAPVLGAVVDALDVLRDVLVRGELERADGDLVEVLEEVVGHVADLLGPGRGPHERLAVRPDLAHDLAELGLEAHVEHAVRLVEHEVRHAAEVRHAGLEEVDEAARRRDDDLDAALQVARLRPLRRAAVDARVLDLRPGREKGDSTSLQHECSARGRVSRNASTRDRSEG